MDATASSKIHPSSIIKPSYTGMEVKDTNSGNHSIELVKSSSDSNNITTTTTSGPSDEAYTKLSSNKKQYSYIVESKTIAKYRKAMFKVVNGNKFQLFQGFLLMLSLFMAESWVLGNAADSTNDTLYGILTFVFVSFSIEVILLSILQPNYIHSFFFWMDLLGTFSIVLDIAWIANSIIPSSGSGVKSQTSVLRATRAAKLGARYGRLMRVLKLIKFIEYIPCLNKKAALEKEKEPTMSAVRKVSNEMNALLSIRVAAVVMLLVIVVPFLAYSVTDDSFNAWVSGIKILCATEVQTGISKAFINDYISDFNAFYGNNDVYPLSIEVETVSYGTLTTTYSHRFKTLRASNINELVSTYTYLGQTYTITVLSDVTTPNSMNALFGIIIVILVILCLVGFSASFQSALDKLMIIPLEKMMSTLRNSATMMLRNLKAMEESTESTKNPEGKHIDDDDLDEELETAVLEKLIEKLARIAKTVLPGSNSLALEDKNIDSATASWLTSNYSTDTKKVASTLLKKEDKSLTQKRLDTLKDKTVSLEELNSWNFNVLNYSPEQLIHITAFVISSLNLFESLNIPLSAFSQLTRSIANRYIASNTYHNFKHGVDVFHTCYRLVTVSSLNDILSPLEVFSLLLAALAHDVGHPGVNNMFLVMSKDPLALRFNDKSPLENMHSALLYEIMSTDSECNVMCNCTDVQWRESRKIILACILGTDMALHFDQIGKVNLYFEVNGEDTAKFVTGQKDSIDSFGELSNRLFVMEILLHCSDISNPYKPFAICSAWADLVVEEFGRQGDKEKELGMDVSPMMDREKIVLCNMQMGFIEFVVTPLINNVVKVFPNLYELSTTLGDNYAEWGKQRIREIQTDSTVDDKTGETAKLDDRIKKFTEKQSFVNTYKSLHFRNK